MSVSDAIRCMEPMDWLTIGLVVFAGAQVVVQVRSEHQRRLERRLEAEAKVDWAFQYVWAEQFRLEGLADELDRRDLIEMSLLEILKPSDVLPRDWTKLAEAMSCLSVEAGFLGGVAIGLCHDVERSIAILVHSVHSFANPPRSEIDISTKIRNVRQLYAKDLAPWETAVRTGVRELSRLMWDVAKHNPRIALTRKLDFADDLSSDFAKAAIQGLVKRAGEGGQRPAS